MATVALLVACRDVIANLSSICRLLAFTQNDFWKKFLDHPEVVLTCSGGLHKSIGTDFPGIWSTSYFGHLSPGRLSPALVSRLMVTLSFFGKSVAPDGVLRIRIYTLGWAANQLMEEGFFKLFRGTARDSSHQHGPERFRYLVVSLANDEDSTN